MTTASKTFRARTLTDALAQVRDELGPDAVVVRRREGLEGGVAGFFQKAVVEIDAQPGGPALQPAGGGRTSVLDDDAPIVPNPAPMPSAIAPALARDAAAAGFAAALATAERTPAPRPHVDPAVDAIPSPRDSGPEVVPVVAAPAHVAAPVPSFVPEPPASREAVPATSSLLPAVTPGPDEHPEVQRVLSVLHRAGLSERFATALVGEAAVHGLPCAEGEGPGTAEAPTNWMISGNGQSWAGFRTRTRLTRHSFLHGSDG